MILKFGNIKSIRFSSPMAFFTLLSLVYFIFSYTLVYTFGLPRILLYGDDALIMFLLVRLLPRIARRGVPKIIILMLAFLILGIISGLAEGEPFILMLWGMRNNARFFVFFLACYVYLEMSDVELVINSISYIFWVSVPLCLFERSLYYYSTGVIPGDMVGGLFGSYSGCNAPLNLLLVLYVGYTVLQYFGRKINTTQLVLVCAAAMLMAAVAELKVFIVEFLLIIIFGALSRGVSLKSIFIIVGGVILVSIFLTFFIAWNDNGHDYASYYTFAGILDYSSRTTGYTGTGGLNRLTGIQQLIEMFFVGEPRHILIGLGIGFGEYTSFFVGNFYKYYGWLRYQWFHDIWMFLEFGFVGMALYLSIILCSMRKAVKTIAAGMKRNYLLLIYIMCVLLYVYNISLRTETCGFTLFLFLAIPFISEKGLVDEQS